ncbi:glucose-6-phosphate dehydrogenase, partial [Patescibacteria group bacterium]|nr:glucose-6-phosphate dehydrogenase [Patescibacteria group bacterium]
MRTKKTGEPKIPTIMVVFGVTGDLMQKKITPALFNLFKNDSLPERFKIIGFARRDLSDKDFKEKIAGMFDKVVPDFLSLFGYERGFFEKKKDYIKLALRLKEIDKKWGMCSNKLFYLAVPPELYPEILKNLHSTGLSRPCGGPEEGWTRVIVEKPFGKDLKSAKFLDDLLRKLFREEQIYRIDHYLAKEMLQNILAFRFYNNLFEFVWGKKLIESVNIRLFESIGVEDRGGFYDGVGALRDVGQNHLLQMLALVTMDKPPRFTPEDIRRERAKILSTLRIPS